MRINGISEISSITLKFKIAGYKLVKEILKKDNVANIPETTIILKPNLRPLDTIQVILRPSLFVCEFVSFVNNCNLKS